MKERPKLHPNPRAEEMINYLASYCETDIEQQCLKLLVELLDETEAQQKEIEELEALL